MTAGNIVGVDPHRQTFTATILDARGGEVEHAHFTNTRAGHADAVGWASAHDRARSNGHTRRESMRILKRHLSDAIYRTMLRDIRQQPALT